jgi:hypothetical protein
MRYRTRLLRLERRWRPADPSPAFLVVSPGEWPAADRDAFDAGDPAVRDALVERHTGQRPGPYTRLIMLFPRVDGPE